MADLAPESAAWIVTAQLPGAAATGNRDEGVGTAARPEGWREGRSVALGRRGA